MSSSTSGFDRRALKGLRPVLGALALIVAADGGLGVAFRLPDPVSHFAVQPQEGRVFFLGNSMFKTAFDYPAIGAQAQLGYTPPFDAHVGHYTGLWYLYAGAGFRDAKPSLVVWGFRPTYAVYPAFRKREPCDVDLFREYWDENYLAKTRSAHLSAAERFKIRLGEVSFLFGQRERLRAFMTRRLNAAVRSMALALNVPSQGLPLEAVVSGRLGVADLVQRFGSGGATAFTEQNMVDAGRGFITGERADFRGSFVPDIVDRLQGRGIRQLVVIFKPVAYTEGPVPPADREFVDAARRYFERHGVPYLNFVDDPRIQRRHYAQGDHYNAEGRELMTRIMSAKLREVLASDRTQAD